MKKIFTLILLFITYIGYAQLLTENFTYTGLLSANGWTAHSGDGTNNISTTAQGLSFLGYSQSNIGNAALLTTNGQDVNLPLSATRTSGTVYYSFMVNVANTTDVVGDYFTGLYTNSTTFPARFFAAKTATGNLKFGLSKSATVAQVADSVTTYTFGTTYLVVLKYQFLSTAGDDVVSAYIFDGSVPNTEPVSPTLTSNSGTDAASLVSVFLRQGSSTTSRSVNCTIDGLNVTTSWSNIIPVELYAFKGTSMAAGNKLSWLTASEQNNSHFDIERSTDNRKFSKIGEVKGVGTTQVKQSYSFLDENAQSNVSYYRLKQVDDYGTFTYSPIVALVKSGKNPTLKVYPTLVSSTLNLDYKNLSSDAQISIINILGRPMLTQKLADTEGVQSLDLSRLPNGFYFVRLVSGKTQLTQRVQKQ